MILKLPYSRQHHDFSCGPACLRMLFDHLGHHYSEDRLMDLCHSVPRIGTSHDALADEVRREGLHASVHTHARILDILSSIDHGIPLIVNFISPVSGKGHYAVVKGYDKDKKVLILADPKDGDDLEMGVAEFRQAWHNDRGSKGWMMAVLR